MTLDEAISELAAKYCGDCGKGLPVPGVQCPACGGLPQATRQELQEALSEPGKVAQVEADRLRAEAERLRDAAEGAYRDADRVLHLAGLERMADAARGRLDAAVAARMQARAALDQAEAAEAADAGPHRDAYENHRQAVQAEEAARRLRHGPQADIEQKARAGERKTIEGEQKEKPRVFGQTVLAPGSVNIPGGVYSPGVSGR